MELTNCLLHSPEPASGLHPEQDESHPQPHTLSLQTITVTPSLYVCLPRDFFCKLSDELFVSPTHANFVLCQSRCGSPVSIVTMCQAGLPRVQIRAQV